MKLQIKFDKSIFIKKKITYKITYDKYIILYIISMFRWLDISYR